MIGKIIKLTGGFYYIKSGDQVFETRARGNFRHLKVDPIVGDDVEFKYEEKTLKNLALFFQNYCYKT